MPSQVLSYKMSKKMKVLRKMKIIENDGISYLLNDFNVSTKYTFMIYHTWLESMQKLRFPWQKSCFCYCLHERTPRNLWAREMK